MTDDANDNPPAKDDRQARLAQALRANLRKRKAQARARQRATDKEPKTPDDQG